MLRERGCAIRQSMTGTVRAYRTAKTIDGAKSRELGTPPTGAGNWCVALASMRWLAVDVGRLGQPGEESMETCEKLMTVYGAQSKDGLVAVHKPHVLHVGVEAVV